MRLDEAIVNNFDEAERAALAAALGVDWAELPEAMSSSPTPPSAQTQAAALVEALGRRGTSADLLFALAAARPAVPWAELPYPHATLQRLHAALVRRHSLDGLRSLCFRLGVDFDDLPGETKHSRARELVLAMDRAGRTAELWASYELRSVRPRTPTSDELRSSRKVRQARKIRKGRAVLLGALGDLCASLFLNWSLVGKPGTVRLRHSSLLLTLLALGLVAGAMTADSPHPSTAETMANVRPSTIDHTAIINRPSAIVPTTVGHASAAAAATAGYPLSTKPSATPSSTRHSSLVTRHSPIVLVGDRGANLRAGPGPGYTVVVTLRAGARLELRAVSPTGEWYQVRLPGKGSPWIDSRYAVVIGPADVAVATAPVATVPAPSSPTPQATAGHQPARTTPGSPAAPTARPTAMPTRTPAPTSTAAAPPPTPTQPPP